MQCLFRKRVLVQSKLQRTKALCKLQMCKKSLLLHKCCWHMHCYSHYMYKMKYINISRTEHYNYSTCAWMCQYIKTLICGDGVMSAWLFVMNVSLLKLGNDIQACIRIHTYLAVHWLSPYIHLCINFNLRMCLEIIMIFCVLTNPALLDHVNACLAVCMCDKQMSMYLHINFQHVHILNNNYEECAARQFSTGLKFYWAVHKLASGSGCGL